ncbi:sugar ABC transporter ATP-binding protein [Treponema sp. OMZ 840]|uniref:sugar ABC transporter ATP-binding protein n=1 Tax=Treponema sp. OMZ 840 TaxID=244313 RepID=UPI003D8AA6E2
MLLQVKNITKKFFGTTVLKNINVEFHPGEICALIGENGAGKSTLIKIIGGTYQADKGEILIDKKSLKNHSALDASAQGISIVYQEYNLVKEMTVLDNIMLGKEICGHCSFIQKNKQKKFVEKIAKDNNIHVNLDAYAKNLSSAEAKITEILRACTNNMKFLILDEPTAALDDDDVNALFSLMTKLKANGIGIIYISHRLEEIFRICDRVIVLKDGEFVNSWNIKDIDRDKLICSMVGRQLTEIFPPAKKTIDYTKKPVFEVENLCDKGRFHDVTFHVFPGEILGIGGMSGHGQREMIRSLFGISPFTDGKIRMYGKNIRYHNPAEAMKHGIAFLSDDRRNEGLAQEQSISLNIAYPTLNQRSVFGIIKKRKNDAVVMEILKKLNIKFSTQMQAVKELSGGNQQRVVLAKWLLTNPAVILLNEPTLGVDVGAKMEIYELLRELTYYGIAIIMVTSDMMELLNMSDRICVFYEGTVIFETTRKDASEEIIMAAAAGHPIKKAII